MSQNYFYPSSAASANPANGTVGAAAPATATEIAGKDAGGLLQVPLVTATRALAVDGSAVTQPVSAAALPLPAGASTSALQTTGNSSLSSIDGKTPALGQALAAGSVPVVLTAAQLSTLTPLSSVTVVQPTGTNLHVVIDSGTTVVTQATGTNLHMVVDSGTITTVSAVTAITNALPAGANVIGGVTQSGTWTVQPGNTANTTAWLVTQDKAATGTITSVAGSATSVTVLAANAARKHATFYNDSTAILYLAFASTASTTAYTVQIPANGYYELPSGRIFTGLISGIWASAAGNVRVTELS